MELRWIIKRDGTRQEFDPNKVKRAMLMAFDRVRPDSIPNLTSTVAAVVSHLPVVEETVHIEQVQDCVERFLANDGFRDVAAHYSEYRIARARVRAERLHPDHRIASDYVHVSRYARWREDLGGRREVFEETAARCRDMHLERFSGIPAVRPYVEEAFELVGQRVVLPSMRSLQFGGPAILKNNLRMYNCSTTPVDRLRAFDQIFYTLLCGCGVGASVQWHHVDRLPPVRRVAKKVLHFSIPDSIEGWGEGLRILISSAFGGGEWVEYDYSDIRDEGSWLRTTGGLAPGHLPLREALEAVRELLARAGGRKLVPVEAGDIVCHSAEAVRAGGIRRSSVILLFSPADLSMLHAKMPGNFDPVTGLNRQRRMANNSAVLTRGECSREDLERIVHLSQEFAEPAFYFTSNRDYGCNPCAEIGMYPYLVSETTREKRSGFSFCNLTEVSCYGVDTLDELARRVRAAAVIGTLQAAYTDFDYLGGTSEEIAKRDALLGVGLTGLADSPIALDPACQRAAAAVVVETNREVAALIGIRPAARNTTVKPAGKTSAVMGCIANGIHSRWARRYKWRIYAKDGEPPAEEFRRVNPHAFELMPKGEFALVFPVEAPAGAVTQEDETALQFLERVRSTYENWVVPGTVRMVDAPGLTHNVSATCVVRPGEIEEVVAYIWEHRLKFGAVSFAPYTLGQKYPHAPWETVEDDAEWNALVRNMRPVDWSAFKEARGGAEDFGSACEGPQCEIRT
jgi:ribonucleoside-diphosphate reductase alpha chain